MSGDSTWRLFTHRGMETLGIHVLTTWTAVWDTQTRAKTHTDSNKHCFKPQTTISDKESQQPISTSYVVLKTLRISPSVTVPQKNSQWVHGRLGARDCPEKTVYQATITIIKGQGWPELQLSR